MGAGCTKLDRGASGQLKPQDSESIYYIFNSSLGNKYAG